MIAILRLSLPEPPSSNRYWRHARGRTYLSAAALSYRQAVADAYAEQGGGVMFAAGAVAVSFTWYRGKRAGDLDNRAKQVLDALQGLAYTDDAQIVELHAYRQDAPHAARLEVTVYAVHATGEPAAAVALKVAA